MAKKPFAIRVEENVSTRFKALSIVMNIDSAILLGRLLDEKESRLSESEKEAYLAILKVWREEKETN